MDAPSFAQRIMTGSENRKTLQACTNERKKENLTVTCLNKSEMASYLCFRSSDSEERSVECGDVLLQEMGALDIRLLDVS